MLAHREDAKQKKKAMKPHVREKLKEQYPEAENMIIRRNGRTYNLLDYIADDVENYG